MKSALLHKPGDISYTADAKIELAKDIILRVTSTAICGSYLHMLNGAVPQTADMMMGNELIGIVEEVNAEVKNLKKGDRVTVHFPIACDHCFFCHQGASPNC